MPLPAENSTWPPRHWQPAFNRYLLDEALWLNDQTTLSAITSGGDKDTVASGISVGALHRRGLLGIDRTRRWAWGAPRAAGEARTNMPVPIAAALADLSAAQLMAEAPRVRSIGPDGKTVKGNTQTRLDLIANSDDAHMTLIEGATMTAALGAVVMKANWDTTDPDRESVWFDVLGADCAIPTFNSAGRLLEVVLFTTYPDPAPGGLLLRHVERHAPGVIEHALYRGRPESIGRLVPLDTLGELAPIMSTPGIRLEGLIAVVPTGLTRLTAAWWRNRPTRLWRREGALSNAGRSDFELVEPLLDAYQEAWSSLMRDVRLGKARLLVPLGMLEVSTINGRGSTFDTDREIYAEVGGLNPESGTDTIKDFQAAIRYREHLTTLAAIKTEILDAVGWSLASYGQPTGLDGSGGAVTATEVVDRTTKSERTRDEKALYYKQPAASFFRMLAELDGRAYPGKGGGPIDALAIDFPDVSQVDPEKQARTFLDLSTAHAISIEQTVRERRPNWDDDEVLAEVDRIMADIDRLEGGMTDPTALGRIDLTDPAETITPPDLPDEPPAVDEPPADPTA